VDPATLLMIGIVGYFLLTQAGNSSSALAQALQKITTPPAAKPGGGSSGGGAPSGSSAAAQAAHAAAQSGTKTSQATIDALASDGNASDGQVAAYLAALNENDWALADAIIGDVAPVDLESDPNASALNDVYLQPTDVPTYQIPTVTYDPGTTDSSSTDYGDYSDYGEDG